MVARSLSLNDNDEITGLSRVFRQNRNILRATTGRPYEQIRKSNCSINLGLWGCFMMVRRDVGAVIMSRVTWGVCPRGWGGGAVGNFVKRENFD